MISDVNEGIQKRLAEFIGVDERDLPTIRLLDPSSMKKYLYPGELAELSFDSLTKYVNDFKNKALQPFMRSRDISEESSKETIKTIVGKNFKQEVINNEKDVLVIF